MKQHNILTLEEIKKLNWLRFYSSRYCFLTLSYWGDMYIHKWKKILGKGLHTFILISHEGQGSAFYEQNDYKALGTYLAQKAIKNPEYGLNFASELKKQIKTMYVAMETMGKIPNPKDRFHAFLDAMSKYSPWHSCIKIFTDYLPEELRTKLLPALSEARIFSEKVYEDTELFLEKIAKKISAETNYEPSLILTLLHEEIEGYFKSKKLPDKKILQERYKSSALIWANGKFELIVGDAVQKIKKSLFNSEGKTIAKGQTAYKGKAVGLAKIVLDPTKSAHFNDGDILITAMTRPDYVHLLKKAAAVVTDGGGILCHAAIVAREIGIPCIIGTEIATQIFKNGDQIEVDADNGIVTKL